MPGSGLGILSTCSAHLRRPGPLGGTSTPTCERASRAATCSSSRRRTPNPPCIAAPGWTTSAYARGSRDGKHHGRGEADRPVHLEGVHGAGGEDAAAAHKLEQILAAEDLIPGSHDYKEAVELFESFPKDELFQASTDELRRLVVGLLQLEKHGGIRVLVRSDLYGRSVSVVVALPRDRFNAALRKRLQQYFLQEFNGTTVDYHLSLGETESARHLLHGARAPGTQIPDVPYEQLEAEVERLRGGGTTTCTTP